MVSGRRRLSPLALMPFLFAMVILTSAGAGRAQTAADPTRPTPPQMPLPRLDETAAIDGRLDDPAWDRAHRLVLPPRLGQSDLSDADLSAEAVLYWNESGLFVAVSVRDDEIVPVSEDEPLSEYDSVDVWLKNLWVQAGPGGSGLQVQIRQLAGFPAMAIEYDAGLERTETGYAVELFIPRTLWLQAFEADIAAGASFPLAIGVRDRDDAENPAYGKRYFPVWFGWNNVESMAQALLQ